MNFTYTDENGVTQTIELPPQMVREIEQLAEQIQVPFSQALQQVIASGNFLEAVQAGGGKLIVEQDNELREVAREAQAV